MCYAIPGKVVNIKGNIAVVDYFGEKRNVLNEFPDIKPGDYIYAQGGILIDKINKKDALEILEIWEEKFFELKKTDKRLAEISRGKNKSESENLLEILQKINLNKGLSRKELLALLQLKEKHELKLLYETANNLRQREHDNACCVHGIIEFSNHCRNDCFYCGIRKGSSIDRYRMSVEEIINAAKNAVKNLGFKAIVLQSGEDPWYDEEKLVNIVKEIRKLGVLIFLSIGMRDKKIYEKLYRAGARAVLLRFETSNRKIFDKLRPETSFEERIDLIKSLKNMGYLIATGFLVGLPGETDNDIINNILLTKSIGAEMYSFGPFIAAGKTPLEKHKMIEKDTILKIIAMTRLIDRKSKILVTTALETLDKGARKEGLLAGANSLMINVTPANYREKYAIYPGRPDKDKDITKNIEETIKLLYSIGRAPTDIGL